MKREKITVSKIAKEADVSPATVSRVMNHPEIVHNSTITQVEKAMDTLGYRIEQRSYVSQVDQPIIVLNIPSVGNDFYQEVIRGVLTSAKAHGCQLLTYQSPLNKSSVRSFCNLLKRVNASGTILLNRLSIESLEEIHSVVPLVQCCEYNEDASYPYISINDYTAAKNATRYLISCGCNKISLLNGPASFKYSIKRKAGFLSALADEDLFIPQNWIVQLPEVSFDMAYSATCRLLNSETRPHAFFAVSDVFAAAVISASKRFHLNVPNDIMVIGFDNIELSRIITPQITTVNQPCFNLGYSASESLVEMMNQPDYPSSSLLLETELVVRESTIRKW
ncbi:MAG: LacI family DNA-binding transcriptional regulator [Suipraeoptans sp.]